MTLILAAIGIFPGGTVSTARRPFGQPSDPGWRSFTAKMITKSDATIVPIYYDGHNSRLFQVASHLSSNLRLALLINEFRRRIESQVRIGVGAPISVADLGDTVRNGHRMMDELRARTYAMSPNADRLLAYGYEFEDIHKRDQIVSESGPGQG